MQYRLFIFFDVAIMHYLHEDNMKNYEIISKNVQIYHINGFYIVYTKDTQPFD